MRSSSWLAGAWPRRSNHEASIGPADLPQDDCSPRVPARRGLLSQPDLGRYRDLVAADWDDRHDLRLPRITRAGALSRLRRSRRRAAGLLAERDLGDGDAILLGSRRGKPRTLCHGTD